MFSLTESSAVRSIFDRSIPNVYKYFGFQKIAQIYLLHITTHNSVKYQTILNKLLNKNISLYETLLIEMNQITCGAI